MGDALHGVVMVHQCEGKREIVFGKFLRRTQLRRKSQSQPAMFLGKFDAAETSGAGGRDRIPGISPLELPGGGIRRDDLPTELFGALDQGPFVGRKTAHRNRRRSSRTRSYAPARGDLPSLSRINRMSWSLWP